MTAKEIKATVQPGTWWEVTNHYIDRPEHPCYGTQVRLVTDANGSSFYFGEVSQVRWGRASQIKCDDAGTIRLYGGGCAQQEDELFLTLRPVRDHHGTDVARATAHRRYEDSPA